MNRRVIVLHRVSTSAQDLQRQRTDTTRVVQSHGLTAIRTLELSDVSGRHVLDDPQVKGILRDLERPDVAGVVISALDRLFRPDNFSDFAILDYFRKSKKIIWSAKEGQLDPASDAGFMMSLMSGAQAGMEWRTLRQRTMAGKEEFRRAGKHPNGTNVLPRGLTYSKATEKWSYVEPDASRIKLAFDLLFQGMSYRTIAEKIGGAWSDKGVADSLKHKCWMGVFQYTYDRPEPLDVDMKIEPLISEARWVAAQRLILERHSRWLKTKMAKPPEFLLLGLARCGKCGMPMYTRRSGRERDAYYYCKSGKKEYGPRCGARTVQTNAADKTVERIALKELRDAPFLRAALGKLEAARPALDESAGKFAREREKLEAERRELLRLTLKGICTEDDYARESKRIEAEIRSYDRIAPAPLPPVFDPARLIQAIARTFVRFGKQPFQERRAMLMKLVREIVVSNGSITEMTLNGGYFTESANLRPRYSL